jgi:MFS family permease
MVGLPALALAPENRGPGLGIFYTLYYAGMAIGPALAGFSRDLTERAEAPLLFGGAMFIVAALFLVLFNLVRRNEARAFATPADIRRPPR